MHFVFFINGLERFQTQPRHAQFAIAFTLVLCAALFTTVALTNVSLLFLLMTAPFAWYSHWQKKSVIEPAAFRFMALVLVLCAWNVFTNLYAGHGFLESLKALMRHLRPLFFVLLLWTVFANPVVARTAFWALLFWIFTLAATNLVLTTTGQVSQGQYFTTRFSHLSHLYGQALVGFVFVLAQMCVLRPQWFWRAAVAMFVLVMSLFLASERRTGWVLLAVGVLAWGLLNRKSLFFRKYIGWFTLACLGAGVLAWTSQVVQIRMALVWSEYSHYVAMNPAERSAAMLGSVSLRMQYVVTVWEVIRQSNAWVGVGSINLPAAYQAAAREQGVSPQAWALYNWSNPHNEYLFMWATQGLVGLALYVAVFAQACRVAWHKVDELQRVGLIVFVVLFMASITANSMLIDMEEGHFAMLILLIFLPSKTLGLWPPCPRPEQP